MDAKAFLPMIDQINPVWIMWQHAAIGYPKLQETC